MSTAVFSEAELRFLTRMRVARLATADGSGQPHVIPIVFATDGQKLYTPVDDKPKRVAPHELKRVRNLRLNPQVAVVVDEYDEDWTRLAWVLVTGNGEVVEDGPAHSVGMRLLEEKYPQYQVMPLDDHLLIVVTPVRVTSWPR
jgi:PPOX class probable F420-dependent enzyme